MTAATNVTPLVPEALPAPDLIADALAKLKQDPGALFEVGVLVLLRQVRKAEPARWARVRHAAKEAKSISLTELDKLTSERRRRLYMLGNRLGGVTHKRRQRFQWIGCGGLQLWQQR
jgi:hypothetical protein